jgi:ATP-dependent Lon protease
LDHKLTIGLNGQAIQTVNEYITHESGFRNLFGIINAITRVAQHQEADEHFRLESVAGELAQLDKTGWQRLNAIAGNMKEEQRNKVFGIVAV